MLGTLSPARAGAGGEGDEGGKSPGQRLKLLAAMHRTVGCGEAVVQLLKDVNLVEAGSNPLSFTEVGGTLYVSGTSISTGTELWNSDGTDAKTKLLFWQFIASLIQAR